MSVGEQLVVSNEFGDDVQNSSLAHGDRLATELLAGTSWPNVQTTWRCCSIMQMRCDSSTSENSRP